ncbi:hypothetical protein [Paenibacillus sp. A14]|uniref:hypothetical protein n=1 Tax=Paenibacillus sp. A14 TaxID=3119820 RepID=UPI002FE0006D
MPHYQTPRRSATPPSYSPYTSFYPGINPYEAAELPAKAEATALVPLSPGSVTPVNELPAATEAASKSSGGLSLPNLGDLKGIIERLGGIEGIVATMGKVQKVMQTVQQFAPMAKMITSLLPGLKGSKQKGGGGGLDEYKPTRRKSRGKKGRKGASSSRGRKKTGKRRR